MWRISLEEANRIKQNKLSRALDSVFSFFFKFNFNLVNIYYTISFRGRI